MVNKCSAFGCKSGYSGCPAISEDGEKITFHSFPLSNPDLCQQWIRANPRQHFVPTKYSRLCSLHFRHSDFLLERQDTNISRLKKKSEVSEKPLLKLLKPDAVPTIFPNAPAYFTTEREASRTTIRSTATSRHLVEAQRMDELEKSFVEKDTINDCTLSELLQRIEKEPGLPRGFAFHLMDQQLLIYIITVNCDNIPKIAASITVNVDFSVTVTLEEKIVPPTQHSDLFKGAITYMSELLNLMARVKAWSSDKSQRSFSFNIEMAISVLEESLNSLDDDSEECRKVSFVIEQLELIVKNKFGRTFSPKLLILAFIIHASSPAAYTVLLEQNVLCLPSLSTLKKITRRLSSSRGLDNSSYLKLRVSCLNQFQRSVMLVIDEIYIAKRVEYSNGEIQGLTSDGTVASTLLCFMVKSLAGKYRDLVAIYPMAKLTADKLYECYKDVTLLLKNASFNLVAISVDNAATNRKFFTNCLCGGQLQTKIIDSVTEQPIFLIFDPVHNLKNIYNNFQSRKVFECPPMNSNLPEGCRANFHDIVELYNLEATMPLKKAHTLSERVLNPKSIEKTSVKLAVSVFSESTRDALIFYATKEGKTEWSGTAHFISVVIKLWNVMNVRTTTKGKHKRDYTMEPIRSSIDWKLDFLREFADFLHRWKDSDKPGLTRETFLALQHTCLALADCAAYLIDHLGFNYCLLGNLQSDVIEARFGWLRQLSGANYYISYRQVLEGDKKIRALSLLKFSGISLQAIDDSIESQTNGSSCTDNTDDMTADAIAEALEFNITPTASDANVIFYVSGAMSRSVFHITRCPHCKEELIESDAHTHSLNDDADLEAGAFLQQVSRGGLVRPSEYAFMVATESWRIMQEIKSSPQLRAKFLLATNHRALFLKIVDRATDCKVGPMPIVCENFCIKGHDLKALLLQRMFNCFAKNFVKEITEKSHDNQPSKRRKIAKLSGSVHN